MKAKVGEDRGRKLEEGEGKNIEERGETQGEARKEEIIREIG